MADSQGTPLDLVPLTDLRLSYRTIAALSAVGIISVGRLIALPPDELATIPSMGRKSMNEILEAIRSVNAEYCHALDRHLRSPKIFSGDELRAQRAKWGISRSTPTTCVYFIQCEGFIKIGMAADAHIRIGEIQRSNPFKVKLLCVIPSLFASKLEPQLHRRFKHLRVRGEWFRYEGDLAKFIQRTIRETAA